MKAIVAAVQLQSVSDAEFEASMTELRQLAKTLGLQVVGTLTQHRARFDTKAYLGRGKREELRALAERADVVLVDHEISPSQTFNLEKEVGCEVMDRTMVILEIFHRHASSRFARAQVEIARLGYMGPRLREAAKQAGPKDRARSGTGGRSGGESHGELDRRKLRDRIAEREHRERADSLRTRVRPVYLGKDVSITVAEVSPSGRYLLVATSRSAPGQQSTIVPNFVTESGFTENLNARSKVGEVQGSQRVGLLELATGRLTWLEAERARNPTFSVVGWAPRTDRPVSVPERYRNRRLRAGPASAEPIRRNHRPMSGSDC